MALVSFFQVWSKINKFWKIKKHHAEHFFQTLPVMFSVFENLHFFYQTWKKLIWHNFSNIFNTIIMSIFSNSQKLILNKFTRHFWMKITTWTHQTFYGEKDSFQKSWFSWKSNCTYNFWAKSHPAPFLTDPV